jgi:excisionase family DNA binding protein
VKALKELLTTQDVSQMLGISRSTLYTWVQERKMPFVRVGHNVLFDQDGLAQWLTAHKQPAQPQQASR